MSKLEKVIQNKIVGNTRALRVVALKDIKLSIDHVGLYKFAKTHGVLDEERSAEDFAIEFFTAYNNEVCAGTY